MCPDPQPAEACLSNSNSHENSPPGHCHRTHSLDRYSRRNVKPGWTGRCAGELYDSFSEYQITPLDGATEMRPWAPRHG
jgi:hypothetical protein